MLLSQAEMALVVETQPLVVGQVQLQVQAEEAALQVASIRETACAMALWLQQVRNGTECLVQRRCRPQSRRLLHRLVAVLWELEPGL